MKKLIFVVTALLAGCTSRGAIDDLKLITLNDGTKCAVLLGPNAGSISCDWRDDRGKDAPSNVRAWEL